ncbi:hypothetical protein [Pseudobdellovibrio exovorus]|uniref:NAD-dependent epimerase/dehydratase domain-containing protein n=1 Tax=Pseudobdellovibrio exovorus JSS TaxID=1184267 RepID=M4VDX6_9BACT|nr:hypothetical protein [Pseudobdellovibrio exovorus]AGH96695.1 hypothetical protein A11Q_2479 [Pseudobdellovibrio exovorus JSS]
MSTARNILIIGGNRFFGRTLALRLLEQGHRVTLLNRGRIDDDLGSRVQRITLDRKQLSAEQPDLKGQDWDVIFDQVCFDACEARRACSVFQGRVGHYIFTSTMSIYDNQMRGDLHETDFVPEAYQFTSSHASEPTGHQNYGEAKRQAEAVFFQQRAFPVTAVRFPLVLGTDDYTGRLKFHIDHVVQKKAMYFPNINSHISLVSSQDAARSLHHIADKKILGPINCASSQPISLLDFIGLIEDIKGEKALLAKSLETGDHSPYGIPTDWWMNTSKAQSHGLILPPILDWLPPQITHYK